MRFGSDPFSSIAIRIVPDAVNGIRHPGMCSFRRVSAPQFSPIRCTSSRRLSSAGKFAAGQHISIRSKGGMPPVGFIDYLAGTAIFGILVGQIYRDRDSYSPGHVDGNCRLFRREHRFDTEKIHAAFRQCGSNPRVCVPH